MQQTPVQRQQHPTSQAPSRAPQAQTHHPQQQPQPSHDDVFPSGAQFANRLDDFRNGGQGISGQLGAGTQPQTGNIEEFPPLGRNVPAELGQDRRGSLMQSAGFGNYASGMSFAGANQAQSAQNRSMISSVNGPERMMSPATSGAAGKLYPGANLPEQALIWNYSGIGTSRSPVSQAANGVPGQEKEVCFPCTHAFSSLLRKKIQESSNAIMSSQRALAEQQSLQFSAHGQESSEAAQSAEQPPLAEMSELDKFGLAGLLRMIHSDSPDVASLAVGQDLMTLGLDLNQPE